MPKHLFWMSSALAIPLVILTVTAFAHSGATGIVKVRMDAMKAMGKDMKALSFMANGRRRFRPDRVRASASRLARLGQDMPKQFPEGSIHGPSEALPAIWRDWSSFASLARKMIEHANALNGVAADQLSTARPIIEKIGATCSACHKKFRKES